MYVYICVYVFDFKFWSDLVFVECDIADAMLDLIFYRCVRFRELVGYALIDLKMIENYVGNYMRICD